MISVGGADEGEILLIGNGKDDPPVLSLEEIAAPVIVEFRHHDMAAAHEAHVFAAVLAELLAQHIGHPWTACVDQHFCAAGGFCAGGQIL